MASVAPYGDHLVRNLQPIQTGGGGGHDVDSSRPPSSGACVAGNLVAQNLETAKISSNDKSACELSERVDSKMVTAARKKNDARLSMARLCPGAVRNPSPTAIVLHRCRG